MVGHRGVRRHPGVQQLVGAQPQRVPGRRVDPVHRPVGGGRDDRVERARARAACRRPARWRTRRPGRAVRRSRSKPGQHEVGVGVVAVHRGQRLVGGQPGRVDRRPARRAAPWPAAASAVRRLAAGSRELARRASAAHAAGPVGGRPSACLPGGLHLAQRRPARCRCRPAPRSRSTSSSPGASVVAVRHRPHRAELDPLAAEGRPGARAPGCRPGPAGRPRTPGRAQRTWASSTVIFGASDDALGRLRHGAAAVPSAMPSRRATSSRAPATASRSSRSPAVSVGRIVSVSVPKTGPVSRPASSWNTLAPVTSSPCSTACCTGAAPRQAGSSEKCRLTQPCAGDLQRGRRHQRAVGDDRARSRARARAAGPGSSGSRGRAGREHLDAALVGPARATGEADQPPAAPGRGVGPGHHGDELVAGRRRSRRGPAARLPGCRRRRGASVGYRPTIRRRAG